MSWIPRIAELLREGLSYQQAYEQYKEDVGKLEHGYDSLFGKSEEQAQGKTASFQDLQATPQRLRKRKEHPEGEATQENTKANKQSHDYHPASVKAADIPDRQVAMAQVPTDNPMDGAGIDTISKETEVLIHEPETAWLPETKTVVFAGQFQGGIKHIDYESAQSFYITSNYYDYTVVIDGGLHNAFKHDYHIGTENPNGTYEFDTYSNGDYPAYKEQPLFKYGMEYYCHKLYKYYTVLGCEITMRFRNMSRKVGNDILIGTKLTNRSTDINTGTDRYMLPTDRPLREMQQYRDIHWDRVKAHPYGEGINTTIKRYIKANSAKAHPEFDEHRKVWTKVGEAPTYLEQLQVVLYRDPLFGESKQWNTLCNIDFHVRYIVQFKEFADDDWYHPTWTESMPSVPFGADDQMSRLQ
jgi:hypothetical protein